MNDAERALRGEIIRTCLAMEERGINQGTSGNVSARWKDGLLITPSGLAYATMAPEDIIYLEMDGTAHGPHAPSSEWRFHRDIMRERADVGAIVHAHPPYLTGLSILNKDIPAVHYMIAAVGGPSVRCAPYATYGTDELSQNALTALEGRMGCMLANHGVIACGPALPKALWLAGEMETLAQQYVIARQAGEPVVLSDEEIANVIEKFKSYGPRRKDEAKAPAATPAAAEAAPAKAAAPEKPAPPLAATKAAAAAPKAAAKPAPGAKAAPKAKPAAKAKPAPKAAAKAVAAPTAATSAEAPAAKPARKAAAPKAGTPKASTAKASTAKPKAAPAKAATPEAAEKDAAPEAATGSSGASKAVRKKPAARKPRAAKTAR
ncbi:MAG: hypothetical protein AcusKO_00800 [Acuticoccus sp.]